MFPFRQASRVNYGPSENINEKGLKCFYTLNNSLMKYNYNVIKKKNISAATKKKLKYTKGILDIINYDTVNVRRNPIWVFLTHFVTGLIIFSWLHLLLQSTPQKLLKNMNLHANSFIHICLKGVSSSLRSLFQSLFPFLVWLLFCSPRSTAHSVHILNIHMHDTRKTIIFQPVLYHTY